MSTEVQPWEEPAAPVVHLATAPSAPAPAANDIDSWVAMASSYTKLANQIANTDFPPDEMRGKPEAIVAAFLVGREMGLAPMTSLMNLHVIKGKVGQSAHLMRAMILSKGHEIEYDETTDTQCVCRGRRRGEQSWTYVTFTADQARKADIKLGGYPADKLVARATARLARRKFADVIAGMEYTSEELSAGDYVFEDDAVETRAADAAIAAGDTPAEPRRTAKRPEPARSRRATTSGPTPGRQRAAAQRATSASDGPPLPGEEEPTSDQVENREEADVAAGQDGSTTAPAPSSSDGPSEDRPGPPAAKMVTKNQLGKIGALFTEAKVTDRAARLRVVASMADRDISSSTELTQDEASEAIDQLQQLGADGIAALADPANRPAAGGQGQLEEPVDAEVVDEGQDEQAADDTAGADR